MSGIDEQGRRPPRSERNPWRVAPQPLSDAPISAAVRESREQRRAREAEHREWKKKRQSRIKHRKKVREILFVLIICVGLIPFIMGTYVFMTPSDYDTYDSCVRAIGTFDRIEIYQKDMSENQLILLADLYDNSTTEVFTELIVPDEVVRILFEVSIGYETTMKETVMIGGEHACINLLGDIYVDITLSYPVLKSEPFVEWTVWCYSIIIAVVILVAGGLFVERTMYKWLREARYDYYS